MDEKTGSAYEKLAEIAENLESLNGIEDELAGRIDDFNNRISRIEGSLDGLITQLKRLEGLFERLEAVSEEEKKLEAKVTSVIKTVQKAVDGLKTTQDRNAEEIDALSASIKELPTASDHKKGKAHAASKKPETSSIPAKARKKKK